MTRRRRSSHALALTLTACFIFAVILVLYVVRPDKFGRIHFIPTPFAEYMPGSSATLLFVGDIMLSRNIGKLMVKNDDWSYPYRLISDTLRDADLTFGNFENPVSDRGVLSGSIYSFRVDPRAIPAFREAGFDVVSLANNHIWDYGQDAFMDTLTILNTHGIATVGAGVDFSQAHTAVIQEVKGTKVAFLAYTNLLPGFLGRPDGAPAVAYPDLTQISADILEAKKKADIVVVSYHWGDEYETSHNRTQGDLAHATIDAGADLVIGHHPHVVQEVEKYKHGYIAYSLGNFIFDQNFSPDTSHGLMLQVEIKKKSIVSVDELQVHFNSTFQPHL